MPTSLRLDLQQLGLPHVQQLLLQVREVQELVLVGRMWVQEMLRWRLVVLVLVRVVQERQLHQRHEERREEW